MRGWRLDDFVLAVLLLAVLRVSTRTEVAAFIAGLVIGGGICCSLPFVTRWADGMAARGNDVDGTGGPATPLTAPPAALTLHGLRGETPDELAHRIRLDRSRRQTEAMAALDAHAAAARDACAAAGVPDSYLAPDRAKAH